VAMQLVTTTLGTRLVVIDAKGTVQRLADAGNGWRIEMSRQIFASGQTLAGGAVLSDGEVATCGLERSGATGYGVWRVKLPL
jgi:hypothetical protein